MQKYAVTLALLRDEEVLFVRRSKSAREFAGYWSLPTKSISKAEFDTLKLGRSVRCPFFMVEGTVSSQAHRKREGYDLHMILIIANADRVSRSEIDFVESVYSEGTFCSPACMIRKKTNVFGLCVSMLLQHLMRVGELNSPAKFLEIPPSLAEVDLDQLSDLDLWRNAHYSANIVDTENSDRYGNLVKAYTVDRFVKSELFGSGLNFVELGSGAGQLVQELASRGITGTGYDLTGPAAKGPNFELVRRDVLDGEFLRTLTSPTVVMTLFIQWISNLDFLLENLHRAATVRNLVVSWVPIEFSRGGQWVKGADTRWLWCIEDAMSEDPELTMIDSRIGPVRLYKRHITSILNSFREYGFGLRSLEYLNVDRCATGEEKSALYAAFPSARRNAKIPQFVAGVFERL